MSNTVSKCWRDWSAQEWYSLDLSDDEGEGLLYREVPFFEDFERFIRQANHDNAKVGIVFRYELDVGGWLKMFTTIKKRSPPVDKMHLYEYFKVRVVRVIQKRLVQNEGCKLKDVQFYSCAE